MNIRESKKTNLFESRLSMIQALKSNGFLYKFSVQHTLNKKKIWSFTRWQQTITQEITRCKTVHGLIELPMALIGKQRMNEPKVTTKVKRLDYCLDNDMVKL